MSDYTLEQVSNVLSVTDGRLRYWQRIGLFPRRSEGYDWTDLQRAKLLNRLTAEGVPASRLVPYAPLLEGHELHGYSRALVVDGDDGAREVESGQYLLEFSEPAPEDPKTLHYLPQPDEWERQAQAALHDGEIERALDLARGALEANLTDVSSLNNLGLLFLDLEEVDLAVQTLIQACHHPEAGARQWFNLAHSLEAANDPEGAVEALERAVSIEPEFSAARFNLAYTCEALGHTGKAYLHWKAFLEQHPRSEDSERIRKHLSNFYDDGRVVPLRSTR